MKFTAVFIGNGKPVARVEGMTPKEAHDKSIRLALYGGAYHAKLYLGEEHVATVTTKDDYLTWVKGPPTAWAHLLDEDDF